MTTQTFLMTAGIFPNKEIGTEIDRYMRKQVIKIADTVIDNAIYQFTGYTKDELKVKHRGADVLEARQLGMFFYRLNGYSFEQSGNAFHRNHATSLHAFNKIITYYGQVSEKKLTELVDNISKFTGIEVKID